MSHVHVRLLEPTRTEFAGAAAAIAYVTRAWSRIVAEPEMSRVRLLHVQHARRNLEATYIIRIFAEFEAILVEHLTAAHPGIRIPRTAEALINRVALRERIPDPIRDAAQAVRDYRNSLVHRRATSVPTQGFRQVMAGLNRFLVRLP